MRGQSSRSYSRTKYVSQTEPWGSYRNLVDSDGCSFSSFQRVNSRHPAGACRAASRASHHLRQSPPEGHTGQAITWVKEPKNRSWRLGYFEGQRMSVGEIVWVVKRKSLLIYNLVRAAEG